MVAVFTADDLWCKAHTLTRQGAWTHWCENVRPLDFSWKNLIYGPGKRILSFLLNAQINSLPSPSMMKLMGYSSSDICPLCKSRKTQKICTLFHILVGCDRALKTKRYSWRHDSVLATLLPHLQRKIKEINACKPGKDCIPHISSSFVSANKNSKSSFRVFHFQRSLLHGAYDWQLLVDFNHNQIVFPPTICPTDLRPDIVIWSESLKKVIIIELTCPAEENIVAAQVRKSARYLELQNLIKTFTKGSWTSKALTIEVGARGFVARSMSSCLRRLGFSSRSTSHICRSVSLITARCSYAIWCARTQKKWKKSTLLVPHADKSDATDEQRS